MDLPKNNVFKLLGLLLIILIIAGGIITLSTGYLTISADEDEESAYKISEIKKQALNVNYTDLCEHNEEYVDKIIHFEGKIIKVNESNNIVYLTMATKKDTSGNYGDNIIEVWGRDNKFAQNSIVNVYGTYMGLKWAGADYENETIPSIHSIVIE
ncbi:hypothetical protein [Methanococcus voltae]|uniref:Nucleic acid binding OB-fold tRNA/helicase-type n=1 Tax=Methanococcus voltae (strain ATCC BAA-1334 / A3) TaxID=456320 RepID=D7DS18_METV3|nr:hypothetical protein [Methanococcus voltae]MCS3901453.1 hypothetical protein [Methanococcus voltae]